MTERTETPSDDGGEPGSSAPADAEQPPEPAAGRADSSAAADADIEVECDAPLAATERARSIDRAWIATRLAEAVRAANLNVDRLRILILDDAAMTDLHRRHVGEARATDVLSFPGSEPGEPIDADIAICADVAARQAAERGHSLSRELLLYALHGVLHCAGRDDHDPEAYRAMHAEEDRILRAIGVGVTFASEARSTGVGS